jgi:hypothetical protein
MDTDAKGQESFLDEAFIWKMALGSWLVKSDGPELPQVHRHGFQSTSSHLPPSLLIFRASPGPTSLPLPIAKITPNVLGLVNAYLASALFLCTPQTLLSNYDKLFQAWDQWIRTCYCHPSPETRIQ